MKTRKGVLGEKHLNMLSSMKNFTFTWKWQGQNAKAINFMVECVHL